MSTIHGYNLTATVYSAADPGETLDKIVTALAEAGMVAEDTAVKPRQPARVTAAPEGFFE